MYIDTCCKTASVIIFSLFLNHSLSLVVIASISDIEATTIRFKELLHLKEKNKEIYISNFKILQYVTLNTFTQHSFDTFVKKEHQTISCLVDYKNCTKTIQFSNKTLF